MFFAADIKNSLPLVRQKVGKNVRSKIISRRLRSPIFCRVNGPYEMSRAQVNQGVLTTLRGEVFFGPSLSRDISRYAINFESLLEATIEDTFCPSCLWTSRWSCITSLLFRDFIEELKIEVHESRTEHDKMNRLSYSPIRSKVDPKDLLQVPIEGHNALSGS